MAIVKMKRLELAGLNSERKRLIEYIQRLGVLDLADSKDEELLVRETEGAISAIESDIAKTAAALEILTPFAVKKNGFFGKRPEIKNEPLTAEEVSKNKKLTSGILNISRTISKNKDKQRELSMEEKQLEKYLSFDLPLGFKATSKVNVITGALEGDYDAARLWQELFAMDISLTYFEILQRDKLETAVSFVCHIDEKPKLDAFFGRHNFSKPSFKLSAFVPNERARHIRRDIKALEAENDEFEKRLVKFSRREGELRLFYDKLTARRDKYRALSKIGITENVFFIKGYLPEKEAEKIVAELEERFTVSAELFEPDFDEIVPKAFSNNAFVAPVENITYDYALPSSHDVDPNPIMAFFYYLFFGMMFSDAGYGLLMMLVCAIAGYGNFIEKEKRSIYKMFFFCGISTTFWGLMYGSFFGDMLAVVSDKFGKGNLGLRPILFDPVKKPLELLIISVALGLLHILTALSVKLYTEWRSGNKTAAVFDSGLWITLLSGIAVLALGAKTTGLVLSGLSVAGLLLTQGRGRKNIFMKLFGGILSLYNITSYVGDVLSYSRLMALGLATGVIASVVNVLASLGGTGFVGAFIFLLISVFGHSLNFAINMLGAYVHTNRLQYVEFYQKFYEGGGKRYKPFKYNTKYFRFK